MINPTTRPMIGDANNAMSTLITPFINDPLNPASMTTAPINPPMMACDELLGIPRIQVKHIPENSRKTGSDEHGHIRWLHWRQYHARW